MLIGLSIGIMAMITVFTIVINGEYPTGSISINEGSIPDVLFGNETWYSDWINEDLGFSAGFSLDALTGLITVITILIILATVVGIKVLGSGLSDTSIRIITLGSTYLGIWIVLSLFSAPLIHEIEIYGGLIYISITVVYVIGVIQKISEGG